MESSLRLRNSIRNIFFGLIRYVITIIFPFIIRTILINKLGSEYAGINSLFSSILQVLNLSELGFSNVVIFSLYEPIAKNETEKICAIMRMFKKIYKICGLSIFSIGLLLTPFVSHLISGTYPDDINIYLIFIILLMNTSISYLFSGYKSALLIAQQRSDIDSKIQIYSSLLIYVLQIVILLTSHNYYLYVLSMLMGNLFNNILLSYFSKKNFPEIYPKGQVLQNEKKRIYKNVGALFGHQLDAVIITSADNIIISAFLGLNMVAVYNNYYYIISAVLNILIMVANSFVAGIGNSIVIESKENNYKMFISFTYALGLLNILCSVLMYVLFQDFMVLWMGNSMMFSSNTVFLLVFGFYVRQIRRPVLTYKNATGLWRKDLLKPYVAAITNVILNVCLVNLIGINGVIISTFLSMLVIEIPWETKALFDGYFNKKMYKYIYIQTQLFFKLLIITIISVFLLKYITVENFAMFILKIIISGILVSLLIHIFSIKDNEYKNLYSFLKKIRKRRE